ncbi:MAG TPA: hypothetical protein ENI73_02115 [Spirochaetes bacterium]|nr:hypothetical protein [Spirochaetota bacterium]
MGFKRGIASCPATNVFKDLNVLAFEKAVDGKTLRGSKDDDVPAIHLLPALGQKTKIVGIAILV